MIARVEPVVEERLEGSTMTISHDAVLKCIEVMEPYLDDHLLLNPDCLLLSYGPNLPQQCNVHWIQSNRRQIGAINTLNAFHMMLKMASNTFMRPTRHAASMLFMYCSSSLRHHTDIIFQLQENCTEAARPSFFDMLSQKIYHSSCVCPRSALRCGTQYGSACGLSSGES